MKNKKDKSTESADGTLEKIVFSKDNFLIGAFYNPATATEFTAVGNMHSPQVNTNYRLFGQWKEHPSYGRQLHFSWYEIVRPKDKDGIYRYLIKTCEGVGNRLAKRLIDAFGEKTLDILKDAPGHVAGVVDGVSVKLARSIQAVLLENEQMEGTIVELHQIFNIPGIPHKIISVVLEEWGANSIEIIKENPYRLVDLNGIGFETADRVALESIGYNPSSPARKCAAALHLTKKQMQQSGDVWVAGDVLKADLNAILHVPNVSEGIELAIDSGKIVEENNYITTSKAYYEECLVAEKIARAVEYAETC